MTLMMRISPPKLEPDQLAVVQEYRAVAWGRRGRKRPAPARLELPLGLGRQEIEPGHRCRFGAGRGSGTSSPALDGRCTDPYARLVDLERKASYWTDIADYDMETARAMLATGRWLYAVFMCQQAMEKALKAAFLLLRRGNDPPRTHNLTFLLEQLERNDPPDDVVSLANRLSAYYIEARYPSYKVMLSCLVDDAEAKAVVSGTEEALKWIRSLPA